MVQSGTVVGGIEMSRTNKLIELSKPEFTGNKKMPLSNTTVPSGFEFDVKYKPDMTKTDQCHFCGHEEFTHKQNTCTISKLTDPPIPCPCEGFQQ